MGIDFSNLKTGKGEEFIEKHSEVSKIPSKSFNNYTQFIADHYICEIYLGSANDQTGLINWRDYSSRLLRTNQTSVKDDVFLIYDQPLTLSVKNKYTGVGDAGIGRLLKAGGKMGAIAKKAGSAIGQSLASISTGSGIQSDIAITPGRFLDAQFYEKTEPLQFNSTFKFRFGQYGLWNAEEEVFKPALAFLMMSTPTLLGSGGAIETPGPTQLGLITSYIKGLGTEIAEGFKDDPSTILGRLAANTGGAAAKHITVILGQTTTENKKLISGRSPDKNNTELGNNSQSAFNNKLNIENLFSFRPCILESCTVVFSQEKTDAGYPISAEVKLSMKTQFPAISSNFGEVVAPQRKLKNKEDPGTADSQNFGKGNR